MKATIKYIEQKFEEFNILYFENKLPIPPIELCDTKSYLGQCVFKRRKLLNNKVEYYDFRLRINTRIDLPESDVEDIIIHEMIHYYIGFNQIKDKSAHGPIFKQIMNAINNQYGRNIRISHKLSEQEKEQSHSTKKSWHVIAVVTFYNGKTGIKVLPRIIQRILNYYNKVLAIPEVKDIKLYLSCNTYFNRFPNSSSLNIHFIEKNEIEDNIKNANIINCDGRQISIQ